MDLLIKSNRKSNEHIIITPESAGWQYIGFIITEIKFDQTISWFDSKRELCLIILNGEVTIHLDQQIWEGIGKRQNVFDDLPPHAVYIPPAKFIKVTSTKENTLCALCSAPAKGIYPPRWIKPEEMEKTVRGTGTNQRFVTDILPASAKAESLIVVEVRTPSSHSSSYPPHKHDMNFPQEESQLEEIYYHRIAPNQGWVFQRIYTDDRSLDQSVSAEDGDVVLVPYGYHPVVVPHGYHSYYLNVMAGPIREWKFRNDPDHEWMLNS